MEQAGLRDRCAAIGADMFGPSGLLRGLRELRQVLDEGDGDVWTLAAFVLAPNVRLDGESPLTLLRRGRDDDLQAVLRAARAYGEHGAA